MGNGEQKRPRFPRSPLPVLSIELFLYVTYSYKGRKIVLENIIIERDSISLAFSVSRYMQKYSPWSIVIALFSKKVMASSSVCEDSVNMFLYKNQFNQVNLHRSAAFNPHTTSELGIEYASILDLVKYLEYRVCGTQPNQPSHTGHFKILKYSTFSRNKAIQNISLDSLKCAFLLDSSCAHVFSKTRFSKSNGDQI